MVHPIATIHDPLPAAAVLEPGTGMLAPGDVAVEVQSLRGAGTTCCGCDEGGYTSQPDLTKTDSGTSSLTRSDTPGRGARHE